jgi:hypothetical protein
VFHAFPFHGTPHRSLLRDPLPGAPHLSRWHQAYGHELITTPIGRRGKPVKKLRLIPAESAYAMARYFQGRKGTTVSVI